MNRPLRTVKCPQCGTAVTWSSESKWRPFCSERCKTIDLGAWASERYRVQTQESPDTSEAPHDER
jgi:endogenous inhibitor of DNA gyrase (YacG/DUF329 family)